MIRCDDDDDGEAEPDPLRKLGMALAVGLMGAVGARLGEWAFDRFAGRSDEPTADDEPAPVDDDDDEAHAEAFLERVRAAVREELDARDAANAPPRKKR